MLERLKRTKDLEDPEELTTEDLTQVETETKVESPSTGFGSALSAEKQALLDRVGKLEGEVKQAKLDQAKALQKQNIKYLPMNMMKQKMLRILKVKMK